MNKVIHHKTDFEGMRKAGHLAATTLEMLVDVVMPAITTEEIDIKPFEFINTIVGSISNTLSTTSLNLEKITSSIFYKSTTQRH